MTPGPTHAIERRSISTDARPLIHSRMRSCSRLVRTISASATRLLSFMAPSSHRGKTDSKRRDHESGAADPYAHDELDAFGHGAPALEAPAAVTDQMHALLASERSN